MLTLLILSLIASAFVVRPSSSEEKMDAIPKALPVWVLEPEPVRFPVPPMKPFEPELPMTPFDSVNYMRSLVKTRSAGAFNLSPSYVEFVPHHAPIIEKALFLEGPLHKQTIYVEPGAETYRYRDSQYNRVAPYTFHLAPLPKPKMVLDCGTGEERPRRKCENMSSFGRYVSLRAEGFDRLVRS